MSFLAVDKDGDEWIYDTYPVNDGDQWYIYNANGNAVPLPKGSVKKLTGLDITFDDGPVELDV